MSEQKDKEEDVKGHSFRDADQSHRGHRESHRGDDDDVQGHSHRDADQSHRDADQSHR